MVRAAEKWKLTAMQVAMYVIDRKSCAMMAHVKCLLCWLSCSMSLSVFSSRLAAKKPWAREDRGDCLPIWIRLIQRSTMVKLK